ncbi:MAG: hypothetical protein KGQ59_11110 [Bdellovibrionales bacterium]|nr:hypothetical protein [Bdellovibrionales bacterium]
MRATSITVFQPMSLLTALVIFAGCQRHSFSVSLRETVKGGTPIENCPAKEAPDPSKILVYAPDIYMTVGGQKNQNTYLQATLNALKGWNYDVTLESRVDVQMSSCDLYSKYAQVWLYLPCNNLQVMGDSSIGAVREYYRAGRGLAVWGDLHFFNGTTLNDHCNSLEKGYFGSEQSPSSLAKVVESVFGAKVDFTATKTSPITTFEAAPSTHALVNTFSQVNAVWDQRLTLKSQGPLPFQKLNGASPFGRFIVEDGSTASTRRRAFMSISDYNYHSLGLTASQNSELPSTLKKATCEVASYFSGRPLSGCNAPVSAIAKTSISSGKSVSALQSIQEISKRPEDKSKTVQVTLDLYEVRGSEPEEEIVPALVNLLRFPITSVRHTAAMLLRQHWSKSTLLHQLTANPESFGLGEEFARDLHDGRH